MPPTPYFIADEGQAEHGSNGQGEIGLGIQGSGYHRTWIGPFYPPGTRSSDFLARYAEQFDSMELGLYPAAPGRELSQGTLL